MTDERLAIDGGRPVVNRLIPIAEPVIGEEEVKLVVRVLKSKMLREGGYAREFEKAFSSFVGVKHAVAVNSGSSALLATYLSLFKPGDKILVPSFTFVATASMALAAGLKPLFVDIDLETYTMDVNDLQEKAGVGGVKGVVPVHLYGLPCDLKSIMEVSEDYGLAVVNDSAQALGARVEGREVGCYGDATCYSFYPTKSITTGEGGMIATDNDQLASRARMIKNHGQDGEYRYVTLGFNLRMTDICAAIGLAQLSRLHGLIKARRRNAALLTNLLSDLKGVIDLPREPPGRTHVYNLYTVRINQELLRAPRDTIVKALRAEGVDARVYYPIPLHKQELFSGMAGGYEPLPNTELASRTVFSIPCGPTLNENDITNVAKAVRKVLTAFLKR